MINSRIYVYTLSQNRGFLYQSYFEIRERLLYGFSSRRLAVRVRFLQVLQHVQGNIMERYKKSVVTDLITFQDKQSESRTIGDTPDGKSNSSLVPRMEIPYQKSATGSSSTTIGSAVVGGGGVKWQLAGLKLCSNGNLEHGQFLQTRGVLAFGVESIVIVVLRMSGVVR